MAEKLSKFDVPEGVTRKFKCKVTCYWDSTLFIGEDRTKGAGGNPAQVTFTGPTKIPANFQFENWEEF